MGLKVSDPPRKLRTRIARANNTSYLAETDGEVSAVYIAGGSTDYLTFLTDGSDPPTTLMDATEGPATGVTKANGITCSVIKGDYWKVVHSGIGSVSIYWLPEN